MEPGFDAVLVRYGELSLKGPKVRRQFELRLLDNISGCLGGAGIDHSIRRIRGRIVVLTSKAQAACELLSKVFGVVSASPAITVPPDHEAIKAEALRLGKQCITKDTPFRVDANRADKSFPLSSQEVNAEVGELIRRETGGRVDLKKPAVTIGIDIRDQAFVFNQVVKGPGGLPLGTGGRAVSLFSGGIDSPVATYLMMKRGCEMVLLHLDNAPFYRGTSVERVKRVASALKRYACGSRMRLLVVPQGHCLSTFIQSCPRALTCILCKRMMTRIAERIAKLHACTAIVSGSSLGQVCSQTMQNLGLTVSASSLPVLMPLVGLDKEEIVRIAKEIGTYTESTKSAVTCSAVPRRPRTAPTAGQVQEAESRVDLEGMMARSLEGMEEVELG